MSDYGAFWVIKNIRPCKSTSISSEVQRDINWKGLMEEEFQLAEKPATRHSVSGIHSFLNPILDLMESLKVNGVAVLVLHLFHYLY